ncbi:MAG: hypothetical protein MUP98_06315, partial [Candidatus Aminicenantes bacterium]|nr:hypothetical protein [Candidatus Aminicenantes bacterium]
GVVMAVLVLMSISFTQSQVKIQVKPDSPPGLDKKVPTEPEATWAVRLPTSDPDSMFYGVGDGYYEDNGVNIEVSVKKNPISGPYKRFFNFGYAFDFILTNDNLGTVDPPTDQVGFQSVGGLSEIDYPNPDKPFDLFPLGMNIETFLNNEHPYSDGIEANAYESIWFEVHIFDQDIELMEPGDIYVFGSDRDAGDPGDYLSIWARYREVCSPEPVYHDAFLYRNINVERALANGFTPNIEIEKIDANTWRFRVHSDADGFLNVKERYCTIVKRKPRTIYTMEAKAGFDFTIDFIKIDPPTN